MLRPPTLTGVHTASANTSLASLEIRTGVDVLGRREAQRLGAPDRRTLPRRPHLAPRASFVRTCTDGLLKVCVARVGKQQLNRESPQRTLYRPSDGSIRGVLIPRHLEGAMYLSVELLVL